MAYRWDDLRDDNIQVEWGEDIRRTSNRRARASGYWSPQSRPNWLSTAMVVVSTLGAVGIATLVALALVRSPIPMRDEGDASKAETIDWIGSQPLPSKSPSITPTFSPTTGAPTPKPTMRPTPSPTVRSSQSPSVSSSAVPSIAQSESPSAPPTAVKSAPPSIYVHKAPPAPAPVPAPVPVPCVDKMGVFYNHARDKVPCDWFQTVGTYNYKQNCGKTDVGMACVLSCREYNNCILATDPPSFRPSAGPTTAGPTVNPSPGPPKSLTFAATGDATIKQAQPAGNFGSSSYLHIDGAPLPQDLSPGQTGGAFHGLLRFDIDKHDSTRSVESAEIRLKSANSCSSGGYLQKTESPHWDEASITWDTAPDGDGTTIATFGTIQNGFWYTIDVTNVLALHPGHKTLSFRLYPLSSDECIFVSKNNNNGDGPELRIEYDN